MTVLSQVLEETGYDVSSQLNDDDYFNTIVREQSITLFIAVGVSEDFPFKTRTRKEISVIFLSICIPITDPTPF